MPLTATKRFMNWTGVVFTPIVGTAVTLTGVTSVSIDAGGSVAKFAGDGDRYNTTIVNDFNDPAITVQCADLAALNQLAPGTAGTFTATHNDARNGVSTGAITYTLANAVVVTSGRSGAHKAFGQGTLTLCAGSADGTTNPLSTAVAT